MVDSVELKYKIYEETNKKGNKEKELNKFQCDIRIKLLTKELFANLHEQKFFFLSLLVLLFNKTIYLPPEPQAFTLNHMHINLQKKMLI